MKDTFTDRSVSAEIGSFYNACEEVRNALVRIRPEDLLNDAQVNPFANRMAAAVYRAWASSLEAVAKAHED
jgi:hypothetical protein